MLYDDNSGLGFGNAKGIKDYYSKNFPSVKYSKEYRTDVVKDGRGNSYRIGEEKGISADEVSTRKYLNSALRSGGDYSDGSDGGSGQQYLPVNPIKGSRKGSGTADLVRLTWRNGLLTKVDAVDIYTPATQKNDVSPILRSIKNKEGQGDEVVVNMKNVDEGQVRDLVQAVSNTDFKLDRVTIIKESSSFYDEIIDLSGSTLNAGSPDLNTGSFGAPAPNPDPVGGNDEGTSGGSSYTGPCHCEGADGGPAGGPVDPSRIIEELLEGSGEDGVA
ncbi:hypothetical protein [Streptomyces sp. CBMA29]|uniref:hypothetical protein n=1 Tax=Streptomyces sp. CBMA29 TaxID=1896314 RepID=UPI001CB74DC4|nr:hypothetical protein [Streptomyces sp. CBMA29]